MRSAVTVFPVIFCDKLVLSLVYAGRYGPLTKPMDVTVQEMNEEILVGEDYDSDKKFNVKSNIIGSAPGLIPNLTDSITVDGELLPPMLNIELDKPFSKKNNFLSLD